MASEQPQQAEAAPPKELPSRPAKQPKEKGGKGGKSQLEVRPLSLVIGAVV